MTIKQYQERATEFPIIMRGEGSTLDLCVVGLINATGRLGALARGKASGPTREGVHQTDAEAVELSGEMLWLLAVASHEFGVDMEAAAEQHLHRLAEAAKNLPDQH